MPFFLFPLNLAYYLLRHAFFSCISCSSDGKFKFLAHLLLERVNEQL